MNDYKNSFPLLQRELDGQPITYLDSASTTPKPKVVIDAVTRYYTEMGANVHRGVHPLGEAATAAYERARYSVAALIGALPSEIVFTRNATESFNLVAQGLALSLDDEVVFPASEHHSRSAGDNGRAAAPTGASSDPGTVGPDAVRRADVRAASAVRQRRRPRQHRRRQRQRRQ